jgi:hypothetical protein
MEPLALAVEPLGTAKHQLGKTALDALDLIRGIFLRVFAYSIYNQIIFPSSHTTLYNHNCMPDRLSKGLQF